MQLSQLSYEVFLLGKDSYLEKVMQLFKNKHSS